MGVNVGAISGKLKKYIDSPAGKKKMAATVQRIREGKTIAGTYGKTQAGDVVVTYDQMQAAAKELISIIRRHAASTDLPASVMANVESFCDSPLVENPDGSASIELNMRDDLTRESLQPENFDGSYNIVAAFNAGYHADGVVYGMWKSVGKKVRSLEQRSGSQFLQSAINEFNTKYAEKYNVTVTLDSVYDKNV